MIKQPTKSFKRPRLWMLVLVVIMMVTVVSAAFAAPKQEDLATQPPEPTNINKDLVYQLDLNGEINGAMEKYVTRAYAAAEEDQAAYMLLVLDTYGGYLDNAVKIKQIIMSSSVKTICYINDKAISAGALVALSCHKIVMAPGSTMGAAEPRMGEEKADEKVVSFWSAELASAAEQNGRDGQLAAAMADSDIAIPDVVEKGKLLTLTTAQSLELKMADQEAVNIEVLLEENQLGSSVIIPVEPDFKEQIAGFLSSPIVAGILLALGIAALVFEIVFAGFGVAGSIGIVSLALYFIGGFLVGYSGWVALVLLLLAILLICLELFVVPGFGITGILGFLCLIGAVISVAPTVTIAIWQIIFAIVVVVILVVVSLKTGKTRRVWSKLILSDKTSTEEGYISQEPGINDYTGQEGIAMTALRPAGAVKIGTKRVDVVTEGDFISVGEKVIVVKVDGSSVIVRKL